ncbi:hypothetical protein HMPREF9209_0991 [Lactobacillus gasseri 224-1]|uniref:ABC transporter ATP-binding protein n=2 Tax=Lactobacillus gasseri TaxID=1596 RepID=A0A133PFJ3_LACGS|nr:hypothetical protein HMPREF0890_0099 [Lactobacillus gasseri 202-4]EFB62355.1 hypothetical protein HMPREF9209_0991 [Lactobacillus gasseri 224-1]KAB1919404.1 ABC transporter ATP-binding protein [Lactobacillus gasseri ATCC 33323 = JCM 1131]KAB1951969.1 ABC transporter ATP-binding protein [Lactobacillus gasseri]MBV6739599.1 ABC transporter ATPase [Lactobacillus gasseri CECT 5714]
MQPISNMLMMILVIGILTYGAIRVMQGSGCPHFIFNVLVPINGTSNYG